MQKQKLFILLFLLNAFILKCSCVAVILIVLLKNHFRRTLETNLQMKTWIGASPNVQCAYGVVKIFHRAIAKLAIIRF